MQPVQLSKQLVKPGPAPIANATLLREQPPSEGQLDFDQFQRYSQVATLLDRMLRSFPGPIRILEVGCNILDLLPQFLDSDRVQVTGCDVERFRSDPNFILIERDQPLAFDSGSYDAVVALEVLEHIAPRDRPSFLADCLRVARHGAIFTCPNGSPQVVEAERWAAAAYRERHRTEHPYLAEHAEFGLPREEEVREQLAAFDCSFAVFDNAPLDDWLAMMVLSETLVETGAPEAIYAQLQEALGKLPRPSVPPYRKIYVCRQELRRHPGVGTCAPFGRWTLQMRRSRPATFSRLAMLAGSVLLENSRHQHIATYR